MKKIIIMLAILAVLFTGCKKNPSNVENDTPKTPETVKGGNNSDEASKNNETANTDESAQKSEKSKTDESVKTDESAKKDETAKNNETEQPSGADKAVAELKKAGAEEQTGEGSFMGITPEDMVVIIEKNGEGIAKADYAITDDVNIKSIEIGKPVKFNYKVVDGIKTITDIQEIK